MKPSRVKLLRIIFGVEEDELIDILRNNYNLNWILKSNTLKKLDRLKLLNLWKDELNPINLEKFCI